MTFSWIRICVFALVSGGGLAFLAWQDQPDRSQNVDRHTGKRVRADDTPKIATHRLARDVLALARRRGRALHALDVLRAPGLPIDDPAVVEEAIRRLEKEVSAPEVDPVEDADHLAPAERFFLPLARDHGFAPLELACAYADPLPCDHLAAFAIAASDADFASITPDVCLALARIYRESYRPRARARWLERALTVAPGFSSVALANAAFHLEQGRLDRANAILTRATEAGASTAELWRRRAQVSVWRGDPAGEAESLTSLLPLMDSEPDEETVRRRLVVLCRYLGRVFEAAEHARTLALASGSPEALSDAADLYFAAGEMDIGFDLLGQAIAVASAPRPWRERRVRLLLQDFRFDAAMTELAAMDSIWPDGDYGQRLEDLLRQRNRTAELADRLERRLERHPDSEVEDELLALRTTLGQHDRVREILARRMESVEDPKVFFDQLLFYRSSGLEGLEAKAMVMVNSPALEEEDVAGVVDVLAGLTAPGYVRARDALADRFPDVPEIWELRLERLHRAANPAEAARIAEAMAASRPDSASALKNWIECAAWAGLAEPEIRARAAWAGKFPADLENRQRRAELLEAEARADEAIEEWTVIADHDGPTSDSAIRLIAALRAAGREEEARGRLAPLLEPDAITHEERLRLAGILFEAHWLDVSLELFLGVLAVDPEEATALLRVGQIRAWGSDPSGAIPYLEHLIAVHGPGDGEAPYLLGEAYHACHREEEGLALHSQALPLLRESDPLTIPRESMIAKILARLGRVEECRAVYDRLTALEPGNQDLLLDYVDAMMVLRQYEEARRLVDLAAALGAEDRRLLRMHGHVLVAERRYEEAAELFSRGLERFGDDAGFFADRGQALAALGEWADASDDLRAALELVPGNVDVSWALRSLHDKLSPIVAAVESDALFVGDSHALEARLAGSVLLDRDRTRLGITGTHFSTCGRADAVGNGDEDVHADITRLTVSLSRRIGRRFEVGGGLDVHANRRNANGLGGWAGAVYQRHAPFTSVAIRGHVNEVLAEPAAAAGLGGASHGIETEIHYEGEADWWWTSGRLAYRSLSFEHPESGRMTDGQAIVSAVLGTRVFRRGPEIRRSFATRRLPTVGTGTTVFGEPPEGMGQQIDAWLGYTGVRLLDDAELDGPLPIGDAYDYVTATGRIVGPAGRGLLYEAELYVGTDLQDPGIFIGGTVGLAWRPSTDLELRLSGSHGIDFGYEGGEGATRLSLTMTLRW